MKTIVYTIACDDEGKFLYRNLAKLLVSSIIRSGFGGTVVVFHNAKHPLFSLGRPNVCEEYIDFNSPQKNGGLDDEAERERRWSLKHQVASILHEEYEWQKLLFIDSDCIVTGSLDCFFLGDWQLAIHREYGQLVSSLQFNYFLSDHEIENATDFGVNSGVFCVDRSISSEFFLDWAKAEKLRSTRHRCCLDQAALNRVVLDAKFSLHDCSDLVSMPFHVNNALPAVRRSVITHWVGATGYRKLKASFGLFMETYYYDPSLTLFNLLEV